MYVYEYVIVSTPMISRVASFQFPMIQQLAGPRHARTHPDFLGSLLIDLFCIACARVGGHGVQAMPCQGTRAGAVPSPPLALQLDIDQPGSQLSSLTCTARRVVAWTCGVQLYMLASIMYKDQ
jgi:hypothetical protein